MRTAEEYRKLGEIADSIHADMTIRFNAAESYHEGSPRVPVVVISDVRNKMEVIAAALREAAELREWMQLIYDYDDGAWAAGKHHKAARQQGIKTMRGMAGAALRGEAVRAILGGEPHE